MKELFKKAHETEGFINEFVDKLVSQALSDIEDQKYSKDEMMAYTSMIQNKVNSQLGYHLVSKSIWKAHDFK